MNDLSQRLQAALGQAYHVDRELGGGGMSRVFLAEEVALHRYVVIKVLPPEMSAGVNAERFRREIQLAASLQHPHIVPLLTAGSSGDLLYYVMPHIPGESLHSRLAREGELPVRDALRILRDALDALAEAHARGVVHRDIKPGNVLLSGKHALVTDFGVAKAVSESAKSPTITTLGAAIGTPAYMAPEQAVGDPNVDHRADIYAVGVVAYHMLCGRPPFVASTPEAVLAAHVTQTPEPCTTLRPTVPAALSALVMRCLEKKAADRPQTAEELLSSIETLAAPTGEVPATDATAVSSGTRAAIARHHPARVAALSLVCALLAFGLVYGAVRLIGLPAWVTPATVALLVAGVPVVILTGHHERRRLIEKSTGALHASPAGVDRHFTWMRTGLAGGVAFGAMALVAGAYMAMRVLGIGPVGTLIAKGTLAVRDKIVIADFENRTGDSTLGRTIQDLLRIDLEESPVVRPLTQGQVREALRLMRREGNAPLTAPVAQEVAQREGAKGVLVGELATVGDGYVLAVRLLNATSGEVLVARREAASSGDDLIGAVDLVSRGLRERIGESLRRVQGEQSLSRVTTASLAALRKYSAGARAYAAGEYSRSLNLLREAIQLDSDFAMAYRLLASFLISSQAPRSQVVEAVTKAFELRGRLSERERLLAEASFSFFVLEDRDRAIEAYRGLLDLYPDDAAAWNNLGVAYGGARRLVEAESAYARAVRIQGAQGAIVSYNNLISVLASQGKLAQSEAMFRHWADGYPGHPAIPAYRAQFAILRGEYEDAERVVRDAVPDWRARGGGFPAMAEAWLQSFAVLRGRIREAERRVSSYRAAKRESGARPVGPNPEPAADRLPARVGEALDAASFAVWYGRNPAPALAKLDTTVASTKLDSVPPSDRGYPRLALWFARGGDTVRAREYIQRYDREATDLGPRTRTQALRFMRGQIALAERRWSEAISELRIWSDSSAAVLDLVWVADAYDRAGQLDSALALYERWLGRSGLSAWHICWFLPRTLRRVGQLYEARGDGRKAAGYYLRFADLWKNADIELQPMVREARAKAERLRRG